MSRSGSPTRTRCTSPNWVPAAPRASSSTTTAAVAAGPLLTALRDRPTHLQRFPDGIDGEEIYQKRVPEKHPDYLHTCRVTFPSGRTADALMVTHPSAIVWAAQMGTITFHPWQVRCPDTDHPDELRVDLDPQPGTGFAEARTVAVDILKPLLDELGLVGYPKTSGGRGVHVFLRIRPDWDFIAVRRAGIALAREIERRAPELVTTSWWKEERGQRLFIDYNQNARDRTFASAYSVRATPIATVSTPLTWEELATADPDDYTIATVPALLAERGDPMAGLDSVAQSIEPLLAMAAADEERGLGDLPYPPNYPKMPGEPKRVQPSRDTDRKSQKHGGLKRPIRQYGARSGTYDAGVSQQSAPGDDAGALAAQQEALSLLRASADAMIDPQVLFEAVRDPGGRVVDFVYRSANRAALSYLGVEEAELIGRSARATLPNFEGSGLLGRYAQCLADGQPVILDDFTYFTESLREEWTRGELLVDERRYDVRATKAGADLICLNWSDVTERFQALERIAASERIYRLLVQNSGDVIVHTRECDDGDHEIVWISPNVESLLGGRAENWLGRRSLELVPPEDRAASVARWKTVSAGGEVNQRVQLKAGGRRCALVPRAHDALSRRRRTPRWCGHLHSSDR